jgi:hypothetical protein
MTKVDPRFRRTGRKTTKVVVDDRFKNMFDGEEFIRPVKVDKYGRPVEGDNKDLKRFYRLEEDRLASEEDEDEDEDASVSDKKDSSSDTDSDDDSVSSGEDVMGEALSAHPLVNKDVSLGEATSRLALVNLDWDQITADDIYTLLYGFKPAIGTIEKVTIWTSAFGRERMAKERLEGPSRELFTKTQSNPVVDSIQNVTSDSDSNSDSDLNSDSDSLSANEEKDYDEVALRKYQLERLRYYYAVIECDSPITAHHIYSQCDGNEFEASANFLDLRFIPEGTEFSVETDGTPKDVCLELPKTYRPKPDLVTPALQMSKVTLTWDGDDAERVRMTRGGVRDAKEADLRAYLASSGSEESEADEKAAGKYRQLLLNGTDDVFGRKGDKNDGLQITFASALQADDGNNDDDDDVHMEATFEGEGENITPNSTDQTPFEKYLERRKAKKAVQKEAAAAKKEAAIKERRRRPDKNEKAAVEKERAELSLLLDEQEEDEDSRRRGKKRNNLDIDVDVDDPRFAAVFEESAYALDPSHPAFKRTKGTEKIIKERQRRVHHD